ncbi:MAG: hypothetical protein ACLGH7_07965 [Actinomycetes bacterium]
MVNGNRIQLPLASSGCSCCTPTDAAKPATFMPEAPAPDSPNGVEPSDADTSPATRAHLSQHSS